MEEKEMKIKIQTQNHGYFTIDFDEELKTLLRSLASKVKDDE